MYSIILLLNILLLSQSTEACDQVDTAELDSKRDGTTVSYKLDKPKILKGTALAFIGRNYVLGGTQDGIFFYKKPLSTNFIICSDQSTQQPINGLVPLEQHTVLFSQGASIGLLKLNFDTQKANIVRLLSFVPHIKTLDARQAMKYWLCGLTHGGCYWGNIDAPSETTTTLLATNAQVPNIATWTSSNTAAVGADKIIQIFDIRSGKASVQTLNNADPISALVASKSTDSTFFSGSETGTITCWDLRGGDTAQVYKHDIHQYCNSGPIISMCEHSFQNRPSCLWGSMSGYVGSVSSASTYKVFSSGGPLHAKPTQAVAAHEDTHASYSSDGSISHYYQRTPFKIEALKTLKRPTPLDLCAICHDALQSTNVSGLLCEHYFHTACLTTWFQQKKSCPYCRTPASYAPIPISFDKLKPEAAQIKDKAS